MEMFLFSGGAYGGVASNKKRASSFFIARLLPWWTSGDNVYTRNDHETIIAYSNFLYKNLPEINKETERWIDILWNNYQEWLLK